MCLPGSLRRLFQGTRRRGDVGRLEIVRSAVEPVSTTAQVVEYLSGTDFRLRQLGTQGRKVDALAQQLGEKNAAEAFG